MPKFSANLSLMFTETDMLDRFARAAQAGFDAVEIQFPYSYGAEDLAAAANRAGVQIVLINAPTDDEHKYPGLAGTPGLEEEFRTGLEIALGYAKVLGVRQINVLAGAARGSTDATSCRRLLCQNLATATELLAANGIGTRLEAVNTFDVPGYLVPDVETACAILAEIGHPALKLQFDVYHAGRMGTDPRAGLRKHIDLVGHVQFADCPGRHEPGTGQLPSREIFKLLDELEYDGWVGAEYIPATDTESSLHWLNDARR